MCVNVAYFGKKLGFLSEQFSTVLINYINMYSESPKKSQKLGESYRLKETDFQNKFNLLFDIAHSDS